MVRFRKAGFGAGNHLLETTCPGKIDPRAHVRDFDITGQPLGVGHGVDITEIRLGGASNHGDDFFAARGYCVGVSGNLVQQPSGLGEGVINFVDIGA